MFNCNLCINFDICPEPCEEMERSFKEMGIYSKNYIRKCQDTPFSHNDLDIISLKKAMKLRYGQG